jgi:hypothetical protein
MLFKEVKRHIINFDCWGAACVAADLFFSSFIVSVFGCMRWPKSLCLDLAAGEFQQCEKKL